MTESELCWECRDWLKGSHLLKDPHNHCHHEPKEKANCWCETWTFPDVINLIDSGNRTIKPNFCPQCGRKL